MESVEGRSLKGAVLESQKAEVLKELFLNLRNPRSKGAVCESQKNLKMETTSKIKTT